MSKFYRLLLMFVAFALFTTNLFAQLPECPLRPKPGGALINPPDIFSQNGVLSAAFTMRSSFDAEGYLHVCYNFDSSSTGRVEAPTLRVNPGDQLMLQLTNRLTYNPPAPPRGQAHRPVMAMPARGTSNDPCTGGTMVATSTNVHFHGLNIPPKCHQDEVIQTDIENTDPPFQYSVQIPKNDSPGMFWYHPHLHGFATVQVNGGAPGALIVGGMEKVKPQVSGLPERVFVIRQQFTDPNKWLGGTNQLTINYHQAIAPLGASPVITMKPGAKEFWRVANASNQAFLALQVQFGTVPQPLELIALDGIPVTNSTQVTTIQLPPAGRAEFIVQGPPSNTAASFWQSGVDTGPIGNANPPQQLATIETSANAQEPPALPPAPATPETSPQRFAGLAGLTPTAQRKLYFAEATNGSAGPTEFFIALDGQTPKVFNVDEPPSIVTKVGAVEDWTIENRTGEDHAFHIHQVHFLFLAVNGVPLKDQELRDTVIVPYWDGKSPYPSVKVRMDFRDPEIAGTFVYHCHVLDHEDGGMMEKIKVEPN